MKRLFILSLKKVIYIINHDKNPFSQLMTGNCINNRLNIRNEI